jgi:HEAT repeat protein
VLRNGSPQMRGIVAEMLGRGRWPEAVDILAGLFAERDEVVARGAVAGLILLGDDKAVAVLREVLLDDTMSPVLRALIAQRLGEVRSLASLEALQAALAINLLPEDVMHGVLDSLGKFPFQRTQALYRQLIVNESVDTETKAAAAESLIDAGKSAPPFLTDTAAKAASSEVRAAAAWTAGAHPDTGKLAPQLSAMLQSENDAEVRRRLYEALMRQEQIPATELLQQALTESDPATRIAAANMLAMALNQSAQNGDLQHNFDTQAVPELVAAALGDGSLNLRYRAVFALVRAQTDAAQSALQTIKQYGEPQIAALAGRNLER